MLLLFCHVSRRHSPFSASTLTDAHLGKAMAMIQVMIDYKCCHCHKYDCLGGKVPGFGAKQCPFSSCVGCLNGFALCFNYLLPFFCSLYMSPQQFSNIWLLGTANAGSMVSDHPRLSGRGANNQRCVCRLWLHHLHWLHSG